MKTLRCCTALLLGTLSIARAAHPFEARATTTEITPAITITSTGNNFFDFVDSLLTTHGAFQSLDGRAYNATVNFLGIGDAIQFSTNAPGTIVTITLAPIGFNRTFRGATNREVEDSIEDFFKAEGAQTMAAFLKAIAKTSPIAVTDGNPTSATALSAAASFRDHGFTSPEELAAGARAGAGAKPKFGGISFGMNAGRFEAGSFRGQNYDIGTTLLDFGGEKIRFYMPFSLNYLTLDGGAQVAGGGISLAMPIRLRTMNPEIPSGWNWRVTPLVGASIRGSLDLASLNPLWQAGFINTVDYKVSDSLIISFANQLTTHRSFPLDYSDLSFDPDVDQQIMKNGLRFVTPIKRSPSFTKFLDLFAECFVIDTRFLKDAAVDQFWTFGAYVGWGVTKDWDLFLGGNYDTGDRFKAYSVSLTSAWKWGARKPKQRGEENRSTAVRSGRR